MENINVGARVGKKETAEVSLVRVDGGSQVCA